MINGIQMGRVPRERKTTPEQDLNTGVLYVSLSLYALYVARFWITLDPQPEPLTAAVQAATQATFSGYVAVAGIFLYGLFMLIRFIVRALLRAQWSTPGLRVKLLAAASIVLVLTALVTGHLAEYTALAVLAAMGLNWAVEAQGTAA